MSLIWIVVGLYRQNRVQMEVERKKWFNSCIRDEETEKVVDKREKVAVWKKERGLVDLIVKVLHGD